MATSDQEHAEYLDRQRRTITPNMARAWRRGLRESHAALVAARDAYLEAKAQGAHWFKLEQMMGEVWETRFWYWQNRRRLEHAIIETGAAWSEGGLANVRAANARR